MHFNPLDHRHKNGHLKKLLLKISYPGSWGQGDNFFLVQTRPTITSKWFFLDMPKVLSYAFKFIFMIHSWKQNLIYEYGRLKVKCSLIDVLSVEGLANRRLSGKTWLFYVKKSSTLIINLIFIPYLDSHHELPGHPCDALEDTAIFSSNISEASDDVNSNLMLTAVFTNFFIAIVWP